MSAKEKNMGKKKPKKSSGEVVSDSVGNYEKHPFFIKKAKAAKELLEKIGVPKQLGVKVQN